MGVECLESRRYREHKHILFAEVTEVQHLMPNDCICKTLKQSKEYADLGMFNGQVVNAALSYIPSALKRKQRRFVERISECGIRILKLPLVSLLSLGNN